MNLEHAVEDFCQPFERDVVARLVFVGEAPSASYTPGTLDSWDDADSEEDAPPSVWFRAPRKEVISPRAPGSLRLTMHRRAPEEFFWGARMVVGKFTELRMVPVSRKSIIVVAANLRGCTTRIPRARMFHDFGAHPPATKSMTRGTPILDPHISERL